MKVTSWTYLWVFALGILLLTGVTPLWGANSSLGDAGEGQKIFLTFCSPCHGSHGRGDGEATKVLKVQPRNFADQKYMITRTDQEIHDFIEAKDSTFHGAKYLKNYPPLHLEPEQVWNLVAYIRSLHQQPQGDAVAGRKLYLAYCTTCHGRSGSGQGEAAGFLETKPTDHTDDAIMSTKTDQELYEAIKGGGSAIHASKFMPQWTTTFKPQQIWDLVAYTRFLHRKKDIEGNVVKGRRAFQVYCAFCHGNDGKGEDAVSKVLNPPPTDLTDRKYMETATDIDLYFTILGGGEAVGHSDFMPTWGEVLAESEIWDLIVFIRTLSSSSD